MTAGAEELTSRQRLIGAATELFVRDGYRATSMKAIASHLGISPPALYWHFPSKQELYLTSMESLLDDFVDFVGRHVTATSAPARLRQFVTAHVMWRLDQREAAGAFTAAIGSRDVLHGLPEPHRASLAHRQREHLDRLDSILREGRAAGLLRDDSRVASFAIITMCDYVSSWYDPAGSMRPDRIADLYADCILNMLSPAYATPSTPAHLPRHERIRHST